MGNLKEQSLDANCYTFEILKKNDFHPRIQCVYVCVQSVTDWEGGCERAPACTQEGGEGCRGDAELQVQKAAGWEGRGEDGTLGLVI